MPFPMRIQPVDFNFNTPEGSNRSWNEPKPIVKSRFKRLFERQFSSVSRTSAGVGIEESQVNRDGSEEFEPSSICLAKMVQNFIEESNDKQSMAQCGRSRCNCVNRNCNESSESDSDQSDSFNCFGDSNHNSAGDACEILKSLVTCASIQERIVLAEISKMADKNKTSKLKTDCIRKIVIDGLLALGYDASICKSRWEKSPSFPAGVYEYMDVIVDGDRLIVDIDFRSQFEIARSTKTYKAILQTLPQIFVGKPDRLQRIINIVSDASKLSMKKKGMPFPPWRKAEYVKAKWLSPYTRTVQAPPPLQTKNSRVGNVQINTISGKKVSPAETETDVVVFEKDLIINVGNQQQIISESSRIITG